jgi:hypothetical protein
MVPKPFIRGFASLGVLHLESEKEKNKIKINQGLENRS